MLNDSRTLAWFALGAAGALWGCGASFAPYNELSDFRLLAVRAEPPTLAPGGTSRLDALVYDPSGPLEPADPSTTYSWSWCPVRLGAAGAYECALSEADLRAELAAAGVSADALSFDLGQAPSATFAYPLDPTMLAALCSQSSGPPGGDAAGVLHCESGFPVSVGLSVTKGDKTISGTKTVYLALDGAAPRNANPLVTGLAIAPAKGQAVDAEPLLAVEGTDGEGAYVTTLSRTYELFADVPETAAETFFGTTAAGVAPREQREVLFMTWFIEGGSTASGHTTFYAGTAGFERLAHNTWTLPQPEEFARDHARVILVLRDNRGGVAWLERDVVVVKP